MEVRIASPEEIEKVSALSVSKGNVRFLKEHAVVALLEHNDELVGFAAAQHAFHAAGSWVKEEHRRQRHSYEMRQALDHELRMRGAPVYFALPQSDFEKHLFAKYGTVTEQLVQIRQL